MLEGSKPNFFNTQKEDNNFFKKVRENEQEVDSFINHPEKRIAVFNKYTKKFISGWQMTEDQYDEYLKNNNLT